MNNEFNERIDESSDSETEDCQSETTVEVDRVSELQLDEWQSDVEKKEINRSPFEQTTAANDPWWLHLDSEDEDELDRVCTRHSYPIAEIRLESKPEHHELGGVPLVDCTPFERTTEEREKGLYLNRFSDDGVVPAPNYRGDCRREDQVSERHSYPIAEIHLDSQEPPREHLESDSESQPEHHEVV